MATTLTRLKKNQTARVQQVAAGHAATQRIRDLGLCPGTLIEVVNTAPFNGPVEVRVRGTRVAIGRGLAEKITVETET